MRTIVAALACLTCTARMGSTQASSDQSQAAHDCALENLARQRAGEMSDAAPKHQSCDPALLVEYGKGRAALVEFMVSTRFENQEKQVSEEKVDERHPSNAPGLLLLATNLISSARSSSPVYATRGTDAHMEILEKFSAPAALNANNKHYDHVGRRMWTPPVPSRRTAIGAVIALLATPQRSLALGAEDLMKTMPRDWQRVGPLEEKLRPQVRSFPRSRMDLDFAVLLMRSSYNVADELDFMPMDEFQREMYLLRQNEWVVYKDKLPVTQGDLADPNYFDFMSFCQYATIANGMRNGRQLFEELVDANGTSIVVNRVVATPPSPMSNNELPSAHAERVGERILQWIDTNSGQLAPKLPRDRPPTAGDLLNGVRQIDVVFQLRDYMLTSSLQPLTDGGRQVGISWTLVAPATLWSSQVLALRGDTPVNDFAAKTALAYLRRCGVPATCTTRVEKQTKLVHEIRWPTGFVAA